MSKEQNKDLLKFLKSFPSPVRERALWLRDFIWDLYPSANELIYDNYNALALGWSPTDKVGHTFCSIAVGRTSHNVHFGFYWGSRIADPKKLLIGEGNQYRYLLVKDLEDFPKAYIMKLVKDAYAYSLTLIKPASEKVKKTGEKKPEGMTIVKSISQAKRKKKAPKKK